jgi:hypothetical protein
MNSCRMLVPLAALALISVLTCNGCKSGTQQGASSQQGNAGQPSNNGPANGSNGQPPQAAANQPSAPAPQAPPPPATIDPPAGTRIHVRLDKDLGSKISQPGDSFSATVADDVVVNGQAVIAHGARANGTVIDAKPLGHFKGGAYLEIRLELVHTNWGAYPVATSSIDRAEQGKGKRSAEFIGGGAGAGAIIGAIVGHGKGAAIGALAGGGAGTAGSAFTGNKQIVLPAETPLVFKLEKPLRVTEK